MQPIKKYQPKDRAVLPEKVKLAEEYGIDFDFYMALREDGPTLRAWMQYGVAGGAPEGFVEVLKECYLKEFGEGGANIGHFQLEHNRDHLRARTAELLCFVEFANQYDDSDWFQEIRD